MLSKKCGYPLCRNPLNQVVKSVAVSPVLSMWQMLANAPFKLLIVHDRITALAK